MKASVKFDGSMSLIGSNELGHETNFDSHVDNNGDDRAATPMEVMLQAVAACSMTDVLIILNKQRKEVGDFIVHINGERANEHPRVFTKVHLSYLLISADATQEELEKAVKLSHDTYCSASNMFKRAGCEITWETAVRLPQV
ncbi:MAG TPA: OsmC family protein [Patescibacteria group bacterium]|nr:OsmC family protein [Patescibacteria group bacterium]